MKRLLVTLIAVLLMSPAASIAQEAASLDITALGERVAATDSERLLMRLNTPIQEDLLPEAFSAPQPLGSNLLAEQRAHFVQTLEGLRGSAIYTVEYIPASVAASASPMAGASPASSPTPRGPLTVFTSGTLTYLLFDAPVAVDDLEAFGATMQAALGTDAQAGTVEQIEIQGAPAVLISTVTLVNALEFHTEWIAVPVGSIVVVAMITEGSDTFDEARFRADNEDLAVAGVAYLQRIVEEMGVG